MTRPFMPRLTVQLLKRAGLFGRASLSGYATEPFVIITTTINAQSLPNLGGHSANVGGPAVCDRSRRERNLENYQKFPPWHPTC
jgi:hypothetical protein